MNYKNVHHDDKISMVMSWDDVDRAKNLFLSLGILTGEQLLLETAYFSKELISLSGHFARKAGCGYRKHACIYQGAQRKGQLSGAEDEFFTAIEPRILSLTKRISAKYVDREQIVNFFVKLDDKDAGQAG